MASVYVDITGLLNKKNGSRVIRAVSDKPYVVAVDLEVTHGLNDDSSADNIIEVLLTREDIKLINEAAKE